MKRFTVKGPTLVLAVLGTLLVFSVLGCGGGSNFVQRTPSTSLAALWQPQQQTASYAGKTACRDCHANIHDAYAQQPMGMSGTGPSLRHVGTNCGGCHNTGVGEETGAKLDGSTPHLAGIGCESCHGPGSAHIAASTTADRKATITRTPPDKTCWNCHGGRKDGATAGAYLPGALNDPPKLVTAETYATTAPGSIRGPHYSPAAFLLGRDGYNMTETMPSPHSRIPNTCLACHKPGEVNGKVNHGADAQVPNIDTARAECSSCHSGRGETAVQVGITELMIELGGEDPANPGHFDSSSRGGLLNAYAVKWNINLTTNAAPSDPHVIAYKGARHNFRAVYADHSSGVHNPAFAKRLLEDAKEMLQD